MRRAATGNPWQSLIAAAWLLVLSFLAFGASLDAPFVSDDINAIVANESVTGSLDLAEIFGVYSWWGSDRSDAPGYRPVVTATFAAQHAMGGLDPSPFRALNLVLNALAAFVLFVLARKLGIGDPAALGAASVFAVLPIHSEAVLWIVGRAELMTTCFALGAVVGLVVWRRSGAVTALVAAALALVLGMLSKENAVTVLAAPALLAWCDGSDRPARQRRRRDAVATLALGAAVGLYLAVRASASGPFLPAGQGNLLDNPLVESDGLGHLLGVLAVFGRYLALTLWPASLTIDYSYDATAIGPGFTGDLYSVLGALAAIAALGVGYRFRRSNPPLSFAVLLVLATYSIVSNAIPIGTLMGERLFYLPTAGLCLAAAAALDGRSRQASVIVATGVVLLASLAVDWRRGADWQSGVSLFEAATRATPRSARARLELASLYGREGRTADAIEQFQAALAIKPDYAAAAYNMGNMFARLGRHEAAISAYQNAVDSNPRMSRAWNNLAIVFDLSRRPDDALDALSRGVEAAPADLQLRVALADRLLQIGRNLDAEAHFGYLIDRGVDAPALRYHRGIARHRSGGCAAAIEDYRVAAQHPEAVEPMRAALRGCEVELSR